MGKDVNTDTLSAKQYSQGCTERGGGEMPSFNMPDSGKILHAIPGGEWCILGSTWSFKMTSAEVESL